MIAFLAPSAALLAAAAVPVAIHVLSRRRARRRWFPALALLHGATGGRAQENTYRCRSSRIYLSRVWRVRSCAKPSY